MAEDRGGKNLFQKFPGRHFGRAFVRTGRGGRGKNLPHVLGAVRKQDLDYDHASHFGRKRVRQDIGSRRGRDQGKRKPSLAHGAGRTVSADVRASKK